MPLFNDQRVGSKAATTGHHVVVCQPLLEISQADSKRVGAQGKRSSPIVELHP